MKNAVLALIPLLLCSCSSKTPVNTIVDMHTSRIDEVLDYAYNNIEQTKDVIYLESELNSCKIALKDVEQTYNSEKRAWESEKEYWYIVSVFLGILLCGAIYLIIKRK